MLTRREQLEIDFKLLLLCTMRAYPQISFDVLAMMSGRPVEFIEDFAAECGGFMEPTCPMTQQQIADVLAVSVDMIQKIEQTALLRLQHPARMNVLKELKEALGTKAQGHRGNNE